MAGSRSPSGSPAASNLSLIRRIYAGWNTALSISHAIRMKLPLCSYMTRQK